MRFPSDITGLKFGRLTVLSEAGRTASGNMRHNCLCDCGTSHIVQRGYLTHGSGVQSCGCSRTDANHRKSKGHNGSPEYTAWKAMRQRCAAGKYKGRFTVCERWNDYENFLADMGRKPGPEYSVERKNNDKGYNPGNCRWATPTEQANNTRGNIRVKLGDETISLAEYARRTNVPYPTAYDRYKRGKL